MRAESPLGEYKKIADEVLRWQPNERKYPRAAAECARAYLLLRFAMHLGLRQANLRDLLICYKGDNHREQRWLENNRCGELRWNEIDAVWQVWIPAASFKNSKSSFFRGRPYSAILPDLQNLYWYIDEYLLKHRNVLMGDGLDVATFFVMPAKAGAPTSLRGGEISKIWRETIQHFGIYNPYTRRGAIKGLLPLSRFIQES